MEQGRKHLQPTQYLYLTKMDWIPLIFIYNNFHILHLQRFTFFIYNYKTVSWSVFYLTSQKLLQRLLLNSIFYKNIININIIYII